MSISSALRQLDGDNTQVVSPRTIHETLYQFRAAWPERTGKAASRIDDYFVFGFVRNPWERVVSLYRYLKERRPRREIDQVDSFENFLKLVADQEPWIVELHSMRSQVDFFRPQPDDNPEADFVGHFEHLVDDFMRVRQCLNLPEEPTLGHANRSSNSDRDYRECYTPALIDIVAERFAADINIFGYSFDASVPVNRCSGPLRPHAAPALAEKTI